MKQGEQPIHSKKLQTVSAQIKQLLVDNDIAGVVVLHEDGYIENLVHLSTSYSCCYMEGNLFKANQPIEDSENPGAAKRKIGTTVNMLANVRFKVQQLLMAMTQAEMAVRKKFNIKPPQKPGGNGKIISIN